MPEVLNIDDTTVLVGDFAITGFVAGSMVTVSYPNQKSSMVPGYDSVVFAKNTIGDVGTVTFNVIEGTESDRHLQNLTNTQTTVDFRVVTHLTDGSGDSRRIVFNGEAARILEQQISDVNNTGGEHQVGYALTARRLVRNAE